MKLSRDSWLAIGLLLLLMVVTVAAAVQQGLSQTQDFPTLSSLSSQADGARALWLWLEQLGYRPSNQVGSSFAIPDETSLMLLFEPIVFVTEDDWEQIDEWVEAGGVLVLAGDWWGAASAAGHYDFKLTYQDEATAAQAQTPLLDSPQLPAQAPVQAWRYASSPRDDFVTLLAAGSRPVVVTFVQGQGRVILSAAPYPFSNAGLKQAGNPELVANLVVLVNRPGVVWFDEWHHGLRAGEAAVAGPEDWLRFTPAGHALLLVAAVIFFTLLLRGRRFGRPLLLLKEQARRTPLEHISAIANLSRRASHRRSVLQDYRLRLKRELGKRYRLDPSLPAAEYVSRLAELNPKLDKKALHHLLSRLKQGKVSESEMVQLAAEVAVWLNGPRAEIAR